jgi:hypothetical protein
MIAREKVKDSLLGCRTGRTMPCGKKVLDQEEYLKGREIKIQNPRK